VAETDESRQQLAEEPEPTRRPRRRVVAVGALAVAGVVVLLLAVPVISTLQPGYYERYGDLSVRMEQWRASTHGRMSCAACHVDPGARGMLGFTVRSVPAFYSQLLFGPSDTNLLRPPTTAACQKCHTSYREVSPDGDLLIPHRAHVEILKVECVVCHERLVHSPNTAGINRPKMSGCLKRCHDGEQATAQCTKCHTRKNAPASHAQPDWLKVHSQQAESGDCGKCHAWSPDFCAECHSRRPRSHAGNWKTAHATRAARDSSGCRVCHTEQFCRECH